MEYAVPDEADARPPSASNPASNAASNAAPNSGTALRPTVVPRGELTPTTRDCPDGVTPTDPYVLKFWTAALGPGAVADLLRLVAAARHSEPIRRPLYLAALVREELAGFDEKGNVWVKGRIPFLTTRLLRRLPPGLRAEHRHYVEMRRP